MGSLERKGSESWFLTLNLDWSSLKLAVFATQVQALNQDLLMKRDDYEKSVSELKKQQEELAERRQKEHEKTVSKLNRLAQWSLS